MHPAKSKESSRFPKKIIKQPITGSKPSTWQTSESNTEWLFKTSSESSRLFSLNTKNKISHKSAHNSFKNQYLAKLYFKYRMASESSRFCTLNTKNICRCGGFWSLSLFFCASSLCNYDAHGGAISDRAPLKY